MPSSCSECGGTVLEYDMAAGNGVCVACGMVVEENTIVSEITFGETSSGGAMVQGSFVGQGATGARFGGPYGNRGNGDSRAQTLENASKKIHMVSSVLRLSETISNAALRMYTLAVEHKFTKGRKSMNVVAVCLYIACRQKETYNHMLIDFSDLLQVNVFELGHTYLQLVQTLNLRLPLVDPSHYIARFAALLEFGDETPKVSVDAIRLVQRFDRDWMRCGRRPAGICGAALLLAARMNNFRRSVQEIVQVVKIADTTLKKRLDEFKNTPSGQLTLADFRSVWLDEEVDPPAYTRNKQKEEEDRLAVAEAAEEALMGGSKEQEGKVKGKKKKKKGKRKREESDQDDEETLASKADGVDATTPLRVPLDPSDLNAGILAGTSSVPLFLPDLDEEMNLVADKDDPNIDPALLFPPSTDRTLVNSSSAAETSLSEALSEEMTNYLENTQGAMLSSALDEAQARRIAQFETVDELLGLNEDELDRFILTEDEVKVKERVWVELNRDYLEALAAKGDEEKQATKSKKRRKTTSNVPRDTSNPTADSAADSAEQLVKKNSRYSKRINYDALRNLLVEGPTYDEKDDSQLYTFDDKDDDEGMQNLVVIEGEAEPAPPLIRRTPKSTAAAPPEDDEDEESDKGEDLGWEQEV
ncbi:unnamed protein product [Mycena citricolor]|uniref:B-related factor 1 n=1 Tax=Mycena citricolor TaxID=2018698 RepID=A0AAD2GTI6_9AGAR|nr:unnamed protein product [Mycena citricolor]